MNEALEPITNFSPTGRDAPADFFSEIQTKYISLYGLTNADKRF
jgi:hypothetical protein